jgi:quinol-cytochrome oxidoreductase complex cytochrome b subunit
VIEERLGLGSAIRAIGSRLSRPLPPRSFGVTLGSVATFLFLVQCASGGLLAIYYVPSWDEAHASVVRLNQDVAFGWLVRSVHVWSAHLLVATVLLHLLRTFALGSYARPREATWFAGLLLFGLVMGAAFTGQMLPMDDEAVKGAEVAASYAGHLGSADLVRGGPHVGAPMLTRLFAMHVVWIPMGFLALIAAHLALVGRHRLKGAEAAQGSSPDFPRKLGLSILGVTALLATLAFVFPAKVGVPPDAPGAPASAKPLWMFLPVYQAAKNVSGPAMILLLLGPLAVLAALPFLPRKLGVALGTLLFAAAVVYGVLGATA